MQETWKCKDSKGARTKLNRHWIGNTWEEIFDAPSGSFIFNPSFTVLPLALAAAPGWAYDGQKLVLIFHFPQARGVDLKTFAPLHSAAGSLHWVALFHPVHRVRQMGNIFRNHRTLRAATKQNCRRKQQANPLMPKLQIQVCPSFRFIADFLFKGLCSNGGRVMFSARMLLVVKLSKHRGASRQHKASNWNVKINPRLPGNCSNQCVCGHVLCIYLFSEVLHRRVSLVFGKWCLIF